MTVREAIALAAASAITEVDGVAGPSTEYGTALGGGRIPGVLCTANARGTYDVTLYVKARPVPLAALGERLMGRVADASAQAGFGEDLGDVRVVVLDIVEPE
jgi:hypothetical protein